MREQHGCSSLAQLSDDLKFASGVKINTESFGYINYLLYLSRCIGREPQGPFSSANSRAEKTRMSSSA